MELTARRLNRATLARQLLLERAPVTVEEAVRRVVALQAQQNAAPYVALWNRVTAFDPADLDKAFADGTVVKATLMRITLHAVHRADWAAFHEAMQPTLRARLGDPRFTVSGLAAEDIQNAVAELLAFAGEPRTIGECEAWLAERLGVDGKAAFWGLRTVAPLHHAPTGGPWSFGYRPALVAAPPAADRPGDPETALQHLVLRYLEGFGPASVADIAQFAMVPRRRARQAVEALGDALVAMRGPRGTVHDVPGAPLPDEDSPAPPRLLGMWDSVLLAYADRSRVVPEVHRRHVTRTNGDVLPTLLVDGQVRGVWRAVEDGIEATAFEPLPDEAWAGLAEEAGVLLSLLADREPRAFGRYHHWWARLPAGDTRLLPG